MKCQSVKKQLVLFAGDDLPVRKKKSIEFHIEKCPTCRAELVELRKMKDKLHSIAQTDIPDALHPDFPESVIRKLEEERNSFPLKQEKSKFWLFQNPARAIGAFAFVAILIAAAAIFLLSPGKVTPDKLAAKILSIAERGSSKLAWNPEHFFFKAFDGPFRLETWEAPRQSGVYAVLHKTTSDTGPVIYTVDYCGQGRNLASYRGYPWIKHRIKRLAERTGSKENIYIAVFLMPDSSKQERRRIEEALLKTFNPYFNRGV